MNKNGGEGSMASPKEYHRGYRRAQREVLNGERENLTEIIHEVKFGTREYNINSFKKLYKDRITNKEQELTLNNCLDLLSMINAAKNCLEQEGAFVKNATGSLKVNPAQRELRDSLKAFNLQLEILNNMLGSNEDDDLSGWLDD